MTLLAFTDGASRGNPGDSGIGVILKDPSGAVLEEIYAYLGTSTNNRAEYAALYAGIELARRHKCTHLISHSDSELMVRQIGGTYKIKDKTLREWAGRVHEAVRTGGLRLELKHIPREQNREADELANMGIDRKEPVTDPTLLGSGLFPGM